MQVDLSELRGARSVARLCKRFPAAKRLKSPLSSGKIEGLVQAIAASQALSEREAREELEDFLYCESLKQELERP